jgi:MOSC domain-containing protein YiiM
MSDNRRLDLALTPSGRLESVNIGSPRIVQYRRTTVETSIWKYPVEGPVEVRGAHVGDDVQSDLKVHGGRDKAVYAYASEDLEWWSATLGERLEPGTFGENLTVSGIQVSQSVVGEQWRVGGCLLQVTEPRLPCFKLGLRMGDARFLKRFAKAVRFGSYLRIVEEGRVQAGDKIEVIRRPAHGISVALMGRARLEDPSLGDQVLTAPEIPDRWRRSLEMEQSTPAEVPG